MEEESIVNRIRDAVERDDRIKSANTIYDIGDDLVAKTYHRSGSINYFVARREFDMGCRLHNNGVSVPTMHSLVNIGDGYELQWYVVMDKIKGIEFGSIEDGRTKAEANTKRLDQIDSVVSLGILPKDSLDGKNSLVDEDGRVYLIDFEYWVDDPSDSDKSAFLKKLSKERKKYELISA